MEYVPDTYDIVKMDPTNISNDPNYHSYTYKPINSYVQQYKLPCEIWIKSLPTTIPMNTVDATGALIRHDPALPEI